MVERPTPARRPRCESHRSQLGDVVATRALELRACGRSTGDRPKVGPHETARPMPAARTSVPLSPATDVQYSTASYTPSLPRPRISPEISHLAVAVQRSSLVAGWVAARGKRRQTMTDLRHKRPESVAFETLALSGAGRGSYAIGAHAALWRGDLNVSRSTLPPSGAHARVQRARMASGSPYTTERS